MSSSPQNLCSLFCTQKCVILSTKCAVKNSRQNQIRGEKPVVTLRLLSSWEKVTQAERRSCARYLFRGATAGKVEVQIDSNRVCWEAVFWSISGLLFWLIWRMCFFLYDSFSFCITGYFKSHLQLLAIKNLSTLDYPQ